VSKTSQLVRECSPDYSLERIRELEKELDEAHATIRKIFENLQAWLTEHNLAAHARARNPQTPRPACTCGEPDVGCTFHVEWCPVRSWMILNRIPPYAAENDLGRVKANEIP
jgi:hypothetical protein